MSKNNKPLVSVFMPTYNHELYINEAILSVMNQTYSNWEIIIGDDFSTDRTESVVKSVIHGYEDKIKYVGDNCFGFAPDGGAWFKGDKLVAVFEAKKQGLGGNAYERWWDNACTAKHINPDVVYVTFCSGPGSAQGQWLDNLRRKANIMLGENFKFYMSPEGFTFDQVSAIMQETLEGTL